MVKRILSMALCLIMISSCLVSCGSKITAENPGSYITMYLTDEVYDFDPANAYDNESALKIVSLLFSPLFSIDEKGKVKNELVKSYEIYEDPKASEYKLTLDSNPEFTASVLVAYARAVHKLNQKGDYGCKTVFDVPPAYLSKLSPEELRKQSEETGVKKMVVQSVAIT